MVGFGGFALVLVASLGGLERLVLEFCVGRVEAVAAVCVPVAV